MDFGVSLKHGSCASASKYYTFLPYSLSQIDVLFIWQFSFILSRTILRHIQQYNLSSGLSKFQNKILNNIKKLKFN